MNHSCGGCRRRKRRAGYRDPRTSLPRSCVRTHYLYVMTGCGVPRSGSTEIHSDVREDLLANPAISPGTWKNREWYAGNRAPDAQRTPKYRRVRVWRFFHGFRRSFRSKDMRQWWFFAHPRGDAWSEGRGRDVARPISRVFHGRRIFARSFFSTLVHSPVTIHRPLIR